MLFRCRLSQQLNTGAFGGGICFRSHKRKSLACLDSRGGRRAWVLFFVLPCGLGVLWSLGWFALHQSGGKGRRVLRWRWASFQECLHRWSDLWAKTNPGKKHLALVSCIRSEVFSWMGGIAGLVLFDGWRVMMNSGEYKKKKTAGVVGCHIYIWLTGSWVWGNIVGRRCRRNSCGWYISHIRNINVLKFPSLNLTFRKNHSCNICFKINFFLVSLKNTFYKCFLCTARLATTFYTKYIFSCFLVDVFFSAFPFVEVRGANCRWRSRPHVYRSRHGCVCVCVWSLLRARGEWYHASCWDEIMPKGGKGFEATIIVGWREFERLIFCIIHTW